MISEKNYKKILSFIDEISISEENFEKQVLLAFQRWFGIDQSYFWHCKDNNLINAATLNSPENLLEDYYMNYSRLDILRPKNVMHKINEKRVLGIFDIKTKEEYERSEFYNDFMRKYGLYNNAGIFLLNDNKIIGLVDLASSKNEKFICNDDFISMEIISRFLSQKLYKHLILNESKQSSILLNNYMNILSAREFDVLELVQLGHSNKEIAAQLYVSVNTIKKHIQSLFKKLGVNNRTSLTFKVNTLKY
jgi:DNA-binding CsgD family transcriptional regulator